ncbi:hypothetical protein BP6252_13230 [Coleophoma cylindrospora]|uniref:Peptidase M61 catalytic domain-containing protein n=1 Tax=Coleophoma cylindrospora TaxID=1849047 RepID=A0A3D8QB88_9HELO|nr:hypothetical protein BP6252_13230 [Coleophoma cylindrospora]
MPSLKLLLKPSLMGETTEHAIYVRMTLEIPMIKKDEIVLQHILSRGPVKTMQYTSDDIQIKDPFGTVPVYSRDPTRNRRNFFLERDLVPGQLTIEYKAVPWNPTEASPCGPQIALERDGGGLTAAGMGFILQPAVDTSMDVSIEWDLTSTPPGTRAVCTLGEGLSVFAKIKPATLDECFFAVGPLHSYLQGETGGDFGIYWLENPPFDAVALGRRMELLFPKMSTFFNDENTLYRIFIRRNVQKCVSGRGLHRGFVFAWTSIVPRDEDETEEFLTHETVHNWPRLGFSAGGPTPEELADGWFNEGIAEYYSLFLPFRFGIFSEQELIRRLNIRISGYYTNPDRGVKNKDVQDLFWKGGHVNRIPYQRGFMYFMNLAYQLKKANARSLDELILQMVGLRNQEKPHGIAVWLSLLERELGPGALTEYHSMSDAVPIILSPDCLRVVENLNWTLQRQDQEEFYLGFPEDSLYTESPVVKELDPNSRAAAAGLQEGDRITPQHSFFVVAERWGNEFSLLVKRGSQGGGREELKTISWLPRSWEKVESYQFFKA